MKLYTHPMSSNGRRVSLVARHLGLALDEQLVDLSKGAQRKPEYLALNPNGKVPTLVDGDLALSVRKVGQTRPVSEQLARAHRAPSLTVLVRERVEPKPPSA